MLVMGALAPLCIPMPQSWTVLGGTLLGSRVGGGGELLEGLCVGTACASGGGGWHAGSDNSHEHSQLWGA